MVVRLVMGREESSRYQRCGKETTGPGTSSRARMTDLGK